MLPPEPCSSLRGYCRSSVLQRTGKEGRVYKLNLAARCHESGDEFVEFVSFRKGEEWSSDPKPSETPDWWRDSPAWVSPRKYFMVPGEVIKIILIDQTEEFAFRVKLNDVLEMCAGGARRLGMRHCHFLLFLHYRREGD